LFQALHAVHLRGIPAVVTPMTKKPWNWRRRLDDWGAQAPLVAALLAPFCGLLYIPAFSVSGSETSAAFDDSNIMSGVASNDGSFTMASLFPIQQHLCAGVDIPRTRNTHVCPISSSFYVLSISASTLLQMFSWRLDSRLSTVVGGDPVQSPARSYGLSIRQCVYAITDEGSADGYILVTTDSGRQSLLVRQELSHWPRM
jgi:hypothetical protein